jgi:anti-sigma factor ChrR (cupin superfamily)
VHQVFFFSVGLATTKMKPFFVSQTHFLEHYHLEKGMALRNAFIEQSGDYYHAKYFMSIQRLFHKSRVIENFPCIDLAAFKAAIESEKKTK